MLQAGVDEWQARWNVTIASSNNTNGYFFPVVHSLVAGGNVSNRSSVLPDLFFPIGGGWAGSRGALLKATQRGVPTATTTFATNGLILLSVFIPLYPISVDFRGKQISTTQICP